MKSGCTLPEKNGFWSDPAPREQLHCLFQHRRELRRRHLELLLVNFDGGAFSRGI
jgi:hypothetical protein